MAEPEGGLSPTEYAVGIFLVCLGCAFASTGLLLMKESTVHEGDRPFFLRWRWLIGFCFLGILTTVVDVYVLGILPLSLVAPFAGLTIVFTLLIASSGLMDATEKLSTSDVVGAGLIIAGVTLVSLYGPGGAHGSDASSGDADSSSDDAGGGGGGGDDDDEAAVDDPALAAFQRPLFAGFAGGSLSTVLVWCAVLLIRPTAAATSAGTALSAYSAAVCGALSQLFVKVVAVCLHKADGDFTSPASPFRSLAPYFALGGVAFTAPLQLFLLDTALTGASVAYAVPCYQALLIGLTTVAGGIFFDEFGNMQRSQMAGFGVGVALATCGLALLSARPGDEEAEEEVAMGEAPMRLSQKAEEAPPSPVTLDRSLSTLTPLSNEARASTEWTREERLFARRFSLALRGLPRDVLGLGMLNEKLRRGKRFRARALSFDNHHIYLRFRDREEEAAAARAPKPPTWRRSNTMSELPADRRTARQAAERHYSTRRSPLSRLSPLGRRSPDKRRTDDTASLI